MAEKSRTPFLIFVGALKTLYLVLKILDLA
jgi:hypothetical protein